MNPEQTPQQTPTPNPSWIVFVMDVWLVFGVLSLLLAVWFIPDESDWRALGWLMLEFGLMFLFSALLLRWQLPKTHTPTHQLSALVLVLFLYVPALLSGLCFLLLWTPPTLSRSLITIQTAVMQYQHWLFMALLCSDIACAYWLYRHKLRHTSK